MKSNCFILLIPLSPAAGPCYNVVADAVAMVLLADSDASLTHFCTGKQLQKFSY
jgi:hypothetical protein